MAKLNNQRSNWNVAHALLSIAFIKLMIDCQNRASAAAAQSQFSSELKFNNNNERKFQINPFNLNIPNLTPSSENNNNNNNNENNNNNNNNDDDEYHKALVESIESLNQTKNILPSAEDILNRASSQKSSSSSSSSSLPLSSSSSSSASSPSELSAELRAQVSAAITAENAKAHPRVDALRKTASRNLVSLDTPMIASESGRHNTYSSSDGAQAGAQPPPFPPFTDGIGHSHPHQSFNGGGGGGGVENTQEIVPIVCPACLDTRLIRHYLAKGCEPVRDAGCRCPSRFQCPSDSISGGDAQRGRSVNAVTSERLTMNPLPLSASINDDSDDDQDQNGGISISASGEIYADGCRYNGTIYALGQIVPTRDVCRICVCSYTSGAEVGVALNCETQIQCPAFNTGAGAKFLLDTYRRPRSKMWVKNQVGQLVSSILGPNRGNVSPIRLNCYDYFEHDKCCPRQECVPVSARTGRTLKPRKTCRYGGRQYQLGEKIDLQSITARDAIVGADGDDGARDTHHHHRHHTLDLLNGHDDNLLDAGQFPENFPEETACLSCICTESWNNSALSLSSGRDAESRIHFDRYRSEIFLDEMGDSCRRLQCEMHLDPRFRAGCLPVYRADRCCPVDFICPRTRYMAMRVRGLDFGSKLCRFEGRKYLVGSKLYAMEYEAARCVDCECRVPPDFTCLQRPNCSSQIERENQRAK